MKVSSRAVAFIAGVLAAMAALVSCGLGARQDHVVVVGDSITRLSARALQAQLDERVVVIAEDNVTTADMLAKLSDDDLRGADQIIVNLGTNDVIHQVPVAATVAGLEEVLELSRGARCVHLVTVNEHILSFEDPSLAERIGELNRALTALAHDREDTYLIDWNSAVASHDSEAESSDLFTDSVHPTELGQALLATLYDEALERCP